MAKVIKRDLDWICTCWLAWYWQNFWLGIEIAANWAKYSGLGQSNEAYY